MNFTVEKLLGWAGQHEGDEWTTLKYGKPFGYHVTRTGIEYVPESGSRRNVPRSELESFCAEVRDSRSFSPGDYPDRWHKSYSLPLIQRFLRARGQVV